MGGSVRKRLVGQNLLRAFEPVVCSEDFDVLHITVFPPHIVRCKTIKMIQTQTIHHHKLCFNHVKYQTNKKKNSHQTFSVRALRYFIYKKQK